MVEIGLTFLGSPSAFFDLSVEDQELALSYAYARINGWAGINAASARDINRMFSSKKQKKGLPQDVSRFLGVSD